ncbi:MAG: acetate--CoA ligase family protein [Candidatus Pacearchaeota archaeon]|nr:acetate--CoA ligase family protein [Candidatus Pacearchaeota archaeon]
MQRDEKRGKRCDSRIVFPEYRAKEFLKEYAPSLTIPRNFMIDLKDAKGMIEGKKINEKIYAKYAKKLETFNFCAAVKIVSDNIVHKTDVGAVKLVQDKSQFFSALSSMIKTADKFKAREFMIEELVSGQELIIGIKKDDVFGHVLAFGIGGIFVEILKDISFRACPITMEDAESMIDELKSKKILLGARGKKYDLDVLKKTLVTVSKLPLTKEGMKIEELDINPFILNEHDGKVVDARIVFEG